MDGSSHVDCNCGPEVVVASALLRLHETLAYEWLPETDGDSTRLSTRDTYERLIHWAKGVIDGL